MSDNLAVQLSKWIQENSQEFQIANYAVSRLHDLSASLGKYHPDIALIASDYIDYDTENHASELVNTLYRITQDPRYSTIRLALIADNSLDQDTLGRLAFFVRDIFTTDRNGQLNMVDMLTQLGRPANINNVSQFAPQSGMDNFNQQPPMGNAQASTEQPQYDAYNSSPVYSSSTPPTNNVQPENSDEVEKLQKLVDLYKAQLLMQKKENAGDFVPKSDYDNLLAKAREILNQGSNDPQIKALFQQVMNTNNSYSGKLHEANDMISKQNELINELYAKLKVAEDHQGGRSAETQNLKDQLNEAQREVNTPPNSSYDNGYSQQTGSGYNTPNNDYDNGYSGGNYDNSNGASYNNNQYNRGPYSRTQRPRPARPQSGGNQRQRPRPPRPSRNDPRNTTLPVPVRKKPKQHHEDTFIQKMLKNKILVIGMIGGIALIVLLLVVVINRPADDSNNGVSSTQSSSTGDSFDALVKSGKYDTASKEYPNRAVEAENKMLEDPDVEDKGHFTANILKNSDADPIKFDNFYFEEKYPQAVKLLDNSHDQNLKDLSDARRVMASYAYMKDGKIDKAEKTAKPLKNKTLNKRIEVYKQFSDSNDKLKAKINSGSLSSSEKKKAQQQIKDNEAKMKEL